MRVLVTGGAGYVGSHMAHALVREGHAVVVLDDLSAGHREAVPAGAAFVEGSVADRAAVGAVLRAHGVEAVLHFAARIQVGESVTDPRRYYEGNVGATIALCDAVLDAGVRSFVLSSTAAVYGDPIRVPIDEDHPTVPINPYGETKLAIERMLGAYGRAYGLRWAALRYFNAAGADVAAGLGEHHEPETHLVPIVLDAALGKRPSV
ncbi:MAG TPA: NAD-dependent epimerase/dehydratase family protein, partial [Polyangiaceae bacterium]